ncbi:MAG: SDR family oxidoreductase [Acidimicrobiia bacterium]
MSSPDGSPRSPAPPGWASARRARGATVVGHVLDTGVRDEIDRVVAAVADQHGPVRMLVNNAAVNWAGPVWDYDVDHFDRTMAVNLTGP